MGSALEKDLVHLNHDADLGYSEGGYAAEIREGCSILFMSFLQPTQSPFHSSI